jgi:hypothetical protein
MTEELQGKESLTLKWSTLKGWSLKSDKSEDALRRYFASGEVSAGAMTQDDNAEQKRALCDLIDALDGEIFNDWSGEYMTKDAAKAYVMGQQSIRENAV